MQNRFSFGDQGIDGDLFMRIATALAERKRPAFTAVEFSVRHGHVTLRGKVPTTFDRNLAIATVKLVTGVAEVSDEIEVLQSDSPAQGKKQSGDTTHGK